MKIIIKATVAQREELKNLKLEEAEISFSENPAGTVGDCYFDLSFDEKKPVFLETESPVFVNAVSLTSQHLPSNYIRLNGWPGFLSRPTWEIVAHPQQRNFVSDIMNRMGKKHQFVADIPGMIAARIVATIINEAYFTLDEDISTKSEIDVAMKLGTNYPFGPFEWADMIGLENIHRLLEAMKLESNHYEISSLLVKESNRI